MSSVYAEEASDDVTINENYYIIENIPNDLEQLVEDAGGVLLKTLPQIDIAYAHSEDPDFASKLQGASNRIGSVFNDLTYTISFVEPEGEAFAQEGYSEEALTQAYDPTNAVRFACQWDIRQIDAPGAWDKGVFGDDILVAVLDTGIDPNHQEFVGKVDFQYAKSFLPGSPCGADDVNSIYDFAGHGTSVSSKITTNNIVIAGVAPGAKIVPIKIQNCANRGNIFTKIEAILYAADIEEIDIVQHSSGLTLKRNFIVRDENNRLVLNAAEDYFRVYQKAANYLSSKGKVHIGALGNLSLNYREGGNLLQAATFPNSVIGVYATHINDGLADYSNYGSNAALVGAPGGFGLAGAPSPLLPMPNCPFGFWNTPGMYTVCAAARCGGRNNFYWRTSGTSFSSPIVAGVAALILDANKEKNLNPQQVRAIIKNSADDLGDPGVDNLHSHGRVNANKATD